MKAIVVKTLTKRYGKAVGVEDLSFEVEEGEIFGYLGPNGSGKTTTIRCMMGLLRPTSGRCCLLGTRVLHGRATQHRRIGYLPGDFHIWPKKTARKSLRVLAALGGDNGLKKRRKDLAERLDLDLDRKVGFGVGVPADGWVLEGIDLAGEAINRIKVADFPEPVVGPHTGVGVDLDPVDPVGEDAVAGQVDGGLVLVDAEQHHAGRDR